MKITGLNNCLKALQFDDKSIENILTEAGSNILASTKSGVGQVDSEVANSYNMYVTRDNNGWVINVGSDLKLAAYYEWGTGGFVVVPPETTDAYTMQWYVNGRGSLRPHASLIPSFRIERQRVIQAIQEELKRQFG